MGDSDSACKFCDKLEKKRDVNGLLMCARCAKRYGELCLTYKTRLLSEVVAFGWDVVLTSNTVEKENFPSVSPPLFYIQCKKGAVVVTTAIDKIGFFAAASRLQCSKKAPLRIPLRIKKAPKKARPAR